MYSNNRKKSRTFQHLMMVEEKKSIKNITKTYYEKLFRHFTSFPMLAFLLTFFHGFTFFLLFSLYCQDNYIKH